VEFSWEESSGKVFEDFLGNFFNELSRFDLWIANKEKLKKVLRFDDSVEKRKGKEEESSVIC
jgi:hypothetical protein